MKRPAGRMFTADECEQYGRCLRCEWHPPTQGHAPTCPNFPIRWLSKADRPDTRTTSTTDRAGARNADELVLDLEGNTN
ncbi:hypothetical protein SEA_AYOTOYA_69 [Gordonia phage Ayotoya]|uniref:Uncharacterized protein n=1 Tax=Gordonia phage NancyRae TaxID=2793698 RepID=A0A7T0Q4B8_9CAUD|nr:hypothetical protein SEA_NANCYRAE_67 [Gordonia phage NancyRae]QSL99932.1 hypothetical protein SEA_AYOTOYA_69 [Gordonia phage Ayotoya]QXO14211.1 hypothetical protein SEA_BOCK_70 [Gordonia phage Bock]URP21297.1 hypothetical protein SEA_CHOP_70 [Gordonia phage Chop]UXL91345.1 hypothetical protein SEA_GRANDSLAM_70 [Gordonia phage GrandSlam]